jgi:endonuclease I
MKRFAAIVFSLLLLQCALWAQAGTYYSSIDTASASFVIDLHNLIYPHTRITYDNFDETNIANFAARDTTNGQKVVTCVYSGYNYVYAPPFTYVTFSREHTWCQSWMPSVNVSGFESRPEYSDQHHLFPVHQNNANGRRSNHPLGKVVNVTYQFLEGKLGTDANGHTVYEPRDPHKGDAARALLYMAVCYNGESGYNWTFNNLNQSILPNQSSPEAPQDVVLLKQWSQQDPPDNWETARNDYVYSIQRNRNPFVDHPEYVNVIDFNTLTKTNSTPPATEPTNYVTSFTTGTITNGSIQLTWTDAATGSQAPSGYLLMANTTNSFSAPSDGTTYSDDTNLAAGSAVVNVAHPSSGTYTFSGLTSAATYYFKMYSYYGTGSQRNYKTDASAPAASNTTSGTGLTPNGTLDFGTATDGTTATTSNTAFGGVRIGSGGGSFTIKNPGQTIGSGAELQGIAATGGSINSVGITSAEYGIATTVFTIKFEMYLIGGTSGAWYFFAGNGTSFGSGQTTGFTGAEVFAGLRFVFGASNAITTSYRAAGSWVATGITGTPIAQNVAYTIDVVGNNSASTVTYGSSSVAANTFDLYINGVLVGDDLPKAQLAATTNINAFRFYGENSAANVATIALDNIVWHNFIDAGIPLPVEVTAASTVDDYHLAQNFPNPFNPSTTIRFAVKSLQRVSLNVYNMLGQEVRTLYNQEAEAGMMYAIPFDGSGLSSGVYCYRLRTAERTELKKMLMLK